MALSLKPEVVPVNSTTFVNAHLYCLLEPRSGPGDLVEANPVITGLKADSGTFVGTSFLFRRSGGLLPVNVIGGSLINVFVSAPAATSRTLENSRSAAAGRNHNGTISLYTRKYGSTSPLNTSTITLRASSTKSVDSKPEGESKLMTNTL